MMTSADQNTRGARSDRAPLRVRWMIFMAASGVLATVAVVSSFGAGQQTHGTHGSDHAHEVDAGAVESVVPRQLTPGAPLVSRIEHDGAAITVLVSPMRPGWNLVRVEQRPVDGEDDHGDHGEAVSNPSETIWVGTDQADLRPARNRPEVAGSWSRVWLPKGDGPLYVTHGPDHVVPFPYDAGDGRPAIVAASGPDGPECALAAVGELVAGGTEPVTRCPSQDLADRDRETLRRVVPFWADRRLPGIAVVSDDSRRSRQASRLLRRAAAAVGLPVSRAVDAPEDYAVVVVSGWEAAADQLRRLNARQTAGEVVFTGGTYLAPWLLNPNLLGSVRGAVIPLTFDIRDLEAQRFSIALRAVLPGEQPTAAAFQSWWSERHQARPKTDVRLYAASTVAFMPSQPGHGGHETQISWFPGGTVTPVTNPLPPAA